MANIFKSLAPSDYTVTPFPAYYNYKYINISGSTNNSEDVEVKYGENFVNAGNITRYPTAKYDLYDSILQTFYSPIPYTSYGINPKSFIPDNKIQVISVVQDVYGEKILPGSFTITLNTSKSYDDGKGNIIISSSGTGSIIGTIFYDKGVAVLRSLGYENLNPDSLWEDEAPYPDGWQNLIERKLTSQLSVKDGVFHPFPKQETYAAKIATRTSLYISASSFYNISVTAGEVYKISGWAYANGTTWRGIQNAGVPGSDYQIGYIAVLNGGTAYDGVTTELGPIGWKYLTKDITIPVGTTTLSVGPFIDGPYPAGQGYGDPVCSDSEAVSGCPGYAWFAGLRVERVNPGLLEETTGVLDNRGIFIAGGTTMSVDFSSSVTLYEHAYKVKINPTEFLQTVNNPTAIAVPSGSTKTFAQMTTDGSSLPYITTIGFYNEDNELLMVAKPSVPIQRTKDVTQTFIVKFDT